MQYLTALFEARHRSRRFSDQLPPIPPTTQLAGGAPQTPIDLLPSRQSKHLRSVTDHHIISHGTRTRGIYRPSNLSVSRTHSPLGQVCQHLCDFNGQFRALFTTQKLRTDNFPPRASCLSRCAKHNVLMLIADILFFTIMHFRHRYHT